MPMIENSPYPAVFAPPTTVPSETGATSGGIANQVYAGRPSDAIAPAFGFSSPGPIGPQPWQPPWSSPSGDSGLLSGFASLMNGFINALQTMFASLAQQFGFGGTGSQPAGPETYVKNATASSVGDPHDALSGTNAAGQTIGGKWDNMQSHADLLDSDSFGGGYTVSTATTQPNPNGVTQNARASVALDNGQTDVTLNADGSFSVSSYGSTVQLQKGQSVQLGDGARVTLGSDGALTVADSNAAGGTLSTRLASNGHGGVDASATAQNVDLGGYLVNRTDSAPPVTAPPIAPLPITSPPIVPLPLSPATPVLQPDTFESWDAPASSVWAPSIALD